MPRGRPHRPTAGALAVVLALLVLGLPPRVAEACINATLLSLDARVARLHDAEAALDEGEIDQARELAESARGPRLAPVEQPPGELPPAGEDRLDARAMRVVALSYVRDPEATSAQRLSALKALLERRQARALSDPATDADYAEALARLPDRHAEAYAILAPLAKKDLLGSPNALGALVRLAAERHDDETAYYAKARCEGMIGARGICRGDYPHPPLVRGTTWSYLPSLLVALAALAYRLVRARRVARRGVDRTGRPLLAPWIGHAARLQTLALSAAALYVFARAPVPALGSLVFAAVTLLTLVVERRAFFAAVRRGKVAGLSLRPAGPDDAHLPEVVLFGSSARVEALEAEHGDGAQPGYREAARRPTLRLVYLTSGGRVPGSVVVAAVLVSLVVLVGLLGVLTMRSR